PWLGDTVARTITSVKLSVGTNPATLRSYVAVRLPVMVSLSPAVLTVESLGGMLPLLSKKVQVWSNPPVKVSIQSPCAGAMTRVNEATRAPNKVDRSVRVISGTPPKVIIKVVGARWLQAGFRPTGSITSGENRWQRFCGQG